MDKAKQKFFNDYLEVITFFVFILILLVIYIPSLIWEEEDMYKEESRFRMQTVYNVENFHNILTGSYQPDGKKAVILVNAVRDSVMADSTFLGEQTVKLNGEEFLVDVPKGFDVEYDTTFGLRRISKETIVDTTVTVLMMSEETGMEDTVLFRRKTYSIPSKIQCLWELSKKQLLKELKLCLILIEDLEKKLVLIILHFYLMTPNFSVL